MTASPFPAGEAMEDLVPIPEEAVVLSPEPSPDATPRQMALAALRQALAERQLDLPLGPTLDPEDPARLLSLNRFAVQLACCGFGADQVAVRADHWRVAATAPQLLLAAVVEEENGVVEFPGVLTAAEFVALATPGSEGEIPLDLSHCRGGLGRLLALVRLVEPAALPRLALPPSPATAVGDAVVAVRDWLQGLLADSLSGLGGQLIPASAAPFRSAAPAVGPQGAAVMFSLPLGLRQGQLLWGAAASGAEECFSLVAFAEGEDAAAVLTVRVLPRLEGDLLPEGLRLHAMQGSTVRSVTTPATGLELRFPPAAEPIRLQVDLPGAGALVLPPLSFGPLEP